MADAIFDRTIPFPQAWRAVDFASKDDIAVDLEERHLAAFRAALAGVKGRDPESIAQAEFPLEAIQEDVSGWRREVAAGRGLILLRGFPMAEMSEDEACRLFWGLGTHLGRAVSQSVMGDRLGHVVNIGGKNPHERAYRNSRSLSMHTDACDVIAMYCIRPAAEGGLSGYTSALAIHNALREQAPAHLERLYRGYRYHRFGEQPEGEPPITEEHVPVFSVAEDQVSLRYLRGYIDMAYDELGQPLSGADEEALDAFDALALHPDNRFEFRLEAGEMAIFNNYTVLHNRSGFEDDPDPAKRRHLLRLWLRVPDARPLAPAMEVYNRDRGIPKQEGRDTVYKGPLRYREYGKTHDAPKVG